MAKKKLKDKAKNRRDLPRFYPAGPLALWLVLTTGTMFLFPYQGTFRYADYTLGSISRDEVIAPFTFEILKSDEELELERQTAISAVEPVFIRDDSIGQLQPLQLRGFLEEAKSQDATLTKRFRNRSSVLDSARQMLRQQLRETYGVNLTADSWNYLLRTFRRRGQSPFQPEILEPVLKDIFGRGVLDRPNEEIVSARETIRILSEGEERTVPIASVFDVAQARSETLDRLGEISTPPSDAVSDTAMKIGYELLVPFIVPNILFDSEETAARRETAMAKVAIVKGIVLKNERVIDSNERITQRHLELIRSMEVKRAELAAQTGALNRVLPWIGRFLLAGMIFFVIGQILARFHREIYIKPRNLLMLAVFAAVMIGFYGLVIRPYNISLYLYPAALTAMIFTITFNAQVALYFTVGLSLLVGALTGSNFFATLTVFIPASFSVYSVLRVRTRVQIMRASLSIFAGMLLVILVQRQLTYQIDVTMFRELLFAGINSLATPLLTLGLLILIEFVFGTTTDLTLLELADLNRPLLKRLSLEAPGTYHHSILVGNLAEAAAESIQANPLLIRAGAYYHDIGKMKRRNYFVENQSGSRNIHDTLEPEESVRVLAAHVIDGLDLAKEYRLPEVIKEFIREHHGTGLMVYFYDKALKQRPEGAVSESEFRYPGPKPRSRETGILMLADSAEAATRSLEEPTPEEISEIVRDVVINKYRDEELDYCPLTFSDLSRIIDAFVPILQGIHHHRIRYPSREEMEQAQASLKSASS